MMRPVKNNMQNAFIFQQGVIRCYSLALLFASLLFAGAVIRWRCYSLALLFASLLFAGAVVRFAVVRWRVVRFAVIRFAVIRWRVIHPLARICNPCHHLNINSKTLLPLLPLVSERGVHG